MAEKQTYGSKVGIKIPYLRCIRVPITLEGGGGSLFCPLRAFFKILTQQARFITDTNNANVQNQDRRRLGAFFLLRRSSLVHSADGVVLPCFYSNTSASSA